MATTRSSKRSRKPAGRAAPPTRPAKRSISVTAVAFGTIALALVAAVIFGTAGGPSDFDPGSPEVAGESLPSPGAGADRAAGMTAPVVRGEGFEGETVTIDHDGTAKGILFLAHWCSACRVEVPSVQDWLDSGGEVAGAEIVSVVTAFDETQANYPPNDWLEQEGWTPPVIVDDEDSSVYRAYGGAGSFPYWVFVSADGTVVSRAEGVLSLEALTLFLELAAAS